LQVFKNETTSLKPTLATAMKVAIPALAFAATMGLASPSSAVILTYLNVTGGNTGYITDTNAGGTMSENVYVDPVIFNAAGESPFLAFCVDIYHNINLGDLQLPNQPAHSGLLYDESTLVNNFAPVPTALGANEARIANLVNYGSYLYKHNSLTPTIQNQLSAIQGAIWEIANPGYEVAQSNITLNGMINSMKTANLSGYGSTIKLIVPNSTSYVTQSFAVGVVPEPATWAMMLTGFFGMGAMLRSRRRNALAA
jgi:hypothetical protein